MTTTASPCFIATVHSPANRTIECHHIVPVAWQLHTTITAAPPSPGPDTEGRGMLWDNRNYWLCPTHHRNVHFWIVTIMRHLAQVPDSGDEAADMVVAYNQVPRAQRSRLKDLPVALLALQRLQPFGSLRALIAAGEWGEA